MKCHFCSRDKTDLLSHPTVLAGNLICFPCLKIAVPSLEARTLEGKLRYERALSRERERWDAWFTTAAPVKRVPRLQLAV